MSGRILIKLRGTVVGEVTADELRTQLSRGQIGPLHKISSDGGTTWRFVSEFAELSGGGANPDLAVPTSGEVATTPAPAIGEWHVTCGPDQVGPITADAVRELIAKHTK